MKALACLLFLLRQNFISSTSIRDISTLRTDFLTALSDLGFVPYNYGRGRHGNGDSSLNVNSSNENLVKAVRWDRSVFHPCRRLPSMTHKVSLHVSFFFHSSFFCAL